MEPCRVLQFTQEPVCVLINSSTKCEPRRTLPPKRKEEFQVELGKLGVGSWFSTWHGNWTQRKFVAR